MNALDPRFKAQELVGSCRALLRPTKADRERIQTALRARLGAHVLPDEVKSEPAVGETSVEVSVVGRVS
jgi:hypothetical protein